MARPRQITDEEILEAARECFLEHGPGVSTSAIGEHLGIAQATLFQRFGTKKQLMFAALAPPPVPPFVDRLLAGPDDRDLPEQLLELAEEISGFFHALVPRMAMLRSCGVIHEDLLRAMPEPPPLIAQRAFAKWLQAAHDAGLAEIENPPMVALGFLGSLQILPFLSHLFGDHFALIDRRTYVRTQVDRLWSGIAPRSSLGVSPCHES